MEILMQPGNSTLASGILIVSHVSKAQQTALSVGLDHFNQRSQLNDLFQ